MAGLGFMGATHVAAYAKMPDVIVDAVCTLDSRALTGDLRHIQGNLKRKAGVHDFSAARKCTDWRELVENAELDVIDICLPTDLHAEIAIAALAAGKHVFCEKPMALTAGDCDRMVAAAEENERVLMVGQVLRFWPEYRYLAGFVQSRGYGEIRSATFVRRCGTPDWSEWLMDERRSGGAVVELLVHDVDQALRLFGMPERVSAKRLGEFDAASATLLYPRGPEVRIQGGWFPVGAPLSMSFQVRAETAELELSGGVLRLNDVSGRAMTIAPEDGDAYETELAYFVDCCRRGEKPERCRPEESAQAVKVALLIKESRARAGEQIECAV